LEQDFPAGAALTPRPSGRNPPPARREFGGPRTPEVSQQVNGGH
jgi:hypothetical protein